MKPITKAEQKRIENEIKTFVIQTAIDRLQKMKKSKYWPEGGFRQGYGFSHKIYGYQDIVAVSARFFDEKNMQEGRIMVNTSQQDETLVDKQFSRVIKLLDGHEAEGVSYKFEHVAAAGSSFWFKFTIQ
jgi:hypothetical protein